MGKYLFLKKIEKLFYKWQKLKFSYFECVFFCLLSVHLWHPETLNKGFRVGVPSQYKESEKKEPRAENVC